MPINVYIYMYNVYNVYKCIYVYMYIYNVYNVYNNITRRCNIWLCVIRVLFLILHQWRDCVFSSSSSSSPIVILRIQGGLGKKKTSKPNMEGSITIPLFLNNK